MTVSCYKNGKSILIAACYKGGKSMITSLIIIKIRFVYFSKDEFGGLYIGLHTRSCARLHNHRFCDHGVIIVLFYCSVWPSVWPPVYKEKMVKRRCLMPKKIIDW